MQVVIASIILSVVLLSLGGIVYTFAKLKIRNAIIQNELRQAAQMLIEASKCNTRHERAAMETEAKIKIQLALEKQKALISILA